MTATNLTSITCDGPNCDKSLVFENEKGQEAVNKTEWMRGLILVQTADKRNFSYCSAVCLVEHAGTGVLAPPEEKKLISIEEGKANLALAQAKQLAENKRKSDQALKTGAPIHIE